MYRVSNMGRVWSYYSNWFLTPQRDSSGHMQVRLSNEFGSRLFFIHRLMAEAFIPNQFNYPEVRHLNDISDENLVGNLEWGTQADNMMDASNNGSYAKYETRIIATNIKTGESTLFRSQHEAARRLGIAQGNISHVLRGRYYSCGGYHFEYVENRGEAR